MLRKLLILLLLLTPTAQAAVTSYDYTFVANDVFASDFHTRLNSNFQKSLTGGINSINSDNIVDGSIISRDVAESISPITRTYEGASCEKVYSGLLPAEDSDLTSDISAGTAYPLGYRIKKTSATAHTYTGSRWTYVDLDINGDFQFTEVSIGAATPSVASNSIRLARVSTDSTTINTVTDLRTTSCANGPFSNIGSGTGEPTLDDVFKNGQYVRRFSPAGRTPQGLAVGGFVSWDTHTTFKVTPGSLYINGEYRTASTDITVPQTNDDPAQGVSGLDTSSVAASTTYYVYAIADQSAVKPFSVSFSTSASAPSGITNYRLIGAIKTDANSLFMSRDIASTHALTSKETPSFWVTFNGLASTINPINSFNAVTSITDNGTGTWTIGIDRDMASADYVVSGNCLKNPGDNARSFVPDAVTTSSVSVRCDNGSGTLVDSGQVMVMIHGDPTK